MQTTHTYTRDAAALPASLTGLTSRMQSRTSDAAAETDFPLPLECIAFTPADHRGLLIGFCDLRVAGLLDLREMRIGRVPGGLRVVSPQRGVLRHGELARMPNGDVRVVRPVTVADPDDALAFNRAALAAVRRAYPDALPDAPAAPKTRCASNVAPAYRKELTK